MCQMVQRMCGVYCFIKKYCLQVTKYILVLMIKWYCMTRIINSDIKWYFFVFKSELKLVGFAVFLLLTET